MAELKCSVQNCVHNSKHYCELEKIAVKGVQAKQSNDTCCSTFCECGTSLKNECVNREIKSETSISCSAEQCKYNENCCCSADDVDICGCNASYAENTLCSTFCCK